VHVVGKDILRFHTVYWPAFLMAVGLELPKRVFAHGWWTIEGQKMSKSVGNVVDPFRLVADYGIDATRYFLMCGVPFGSDGDFSESTLVALTNANLANQLGNLLHRTLTLVAKNCDGEAPDPSGAGGLSAQDQALLAAAYELLPACRRHVDTQAVHRIAEELGAVVRSCNEYIDVQAPWTLRKTDPERMCVVLWTLLEALRCVAIMMQPVVPRAATHMLDQLGIPPSAGAGAGKESASPDDARAFAAVCRDRALQPGIAVQKPTPVFPRIEPQAVGTENTENPALPTVPTDDRWLEEVDDIPAAVKAQGERVRELKAQKADKSVINAEVAKLLKLKAKLPAESLQ